MLGGVVQDECVVIGGDPLVVHLPAGCEDDHPLLGQALQHLRREVAGVQELELTWGSFTCPPLVLNWGTKATIFLWPMALK